MREGRKWFQMRLQRRGGAAAACVSRDPLRMRAGRRGGGREKPPHLQTHQAEAREGERGQRWEQ